MTFLDTKSLGDGLHRLAKLALDNGEAASIEDALALFRTYALHIHVGGAIAYDASQQAALLTAANCARRALLGGVTVSGALDTLCCLPGWRGSDLATALQTLGARVAPGSAHTPVIQIGAGSAPDNVMLKTITSGWSGGCVPGEVDTSSDRDAFVLAGVVAGALAVSEIFQRLRGSNPAAGRRSVGLSLWNLSADWDDNIQSHRLPGLLPNAAWLIGLGNLGQAYLWSLGLLPYAEPAEVTLTLQDFDRIAPSNDSTSLLTSLAMVERPKTRVMAEWAESRGFQTRIIERRFAADFSVAAEEPAVALCGVDNALARAALEDAGFDYVIEAGLGGGSDFLAIRLHGFPQIRRARDIWSMVPQGEADLLDMPAYRRLLADGADKCGLAQLAGRTVGAPFVGAIAGAMAIAELVRLANGWSTSAIADFHLRSPGQRTVIKQPDGLVCNPGGCASR